MARLSLNAVSKSFGDKTVVDALSLTIEPGQFVALLGPSGCGKSTILRMLAGFETVSAGDIQHGDQCLSSTKFHLPTEERNFGMVFQSYALWPHMTVMENVGYPLKIQKVDRQNYQRRVQDALDIVQLNDFKDRLPSQLSGGQRQRVALARSLVTEPDVILFDEPLANLDRHLRESMEITFREFHRRTGATMVYVTHDQAEAMALADQIAVLKDGQLMQWSTPEDLYTRPNNEWVANFIGQGSILRCQSVSGNQLLTSTDVIGLLYDQTEHQGRMLVRPQHVDLSATSNMLQGTVRECIFRGERYDIFLVLENGDTLHAYHTEPLEIGETRQLSIQQAWTLEPSHDHDY
ncbi:ABC transporter ATP-binding protein [Marinomonas fungiae]|uniref:ABC-type Fe3+/spermidine/putrescine transport systems, ATPase components n=1 Tax=Marinomonas fungiae TaxID=1137284 RepID=A0A0K6ILM2_9GAMM|nr:ABC transporter ATP-binding protein [Marinomonas fungiae]CUB04207.1 ABC-type Fe3+/spermidine/putrescine transport systems, ATPase components [Marinomonas fungiae]